MAKTELTCFLFPDLTPLEKFGIEPLITAISKDYKVELREVPKGNGRVVQQSLRDPLDTDAIWLLARDWREAARRFPYRSKHQKVFVSVFDLSVPTGGLFALFWKKWHRAIPHSVKLLAHSPLNFRFFREIEGMKAHSVSYLPLSFSPDWEKQIGLVKKQSKPALTVGTLTPLTAEGNLNYFLNVAHYVLRHKPDTQFKILGSGPLYPHLSAMISDLGLGASVSISDLKSYTQLGELDILLFNPLRNDHFLPLLLGAAAELPVVCSDIVGIEDFISDGHSGFVVPVHETKPMGELVLRLLDHAQLRQAIGAELKRSLAEKFLSTHLSADYENLFFPKSSMPAVSIAA